MLRSKLVILCLLGKILLGYEMQSAEAQEACSSLLKYGLYDQYDSVSSSQDYKLLQSWLCDTNQTSYSKASQSAASGGIDILDIVGLSGGTNSTDSEKDAAYHQFCTSSYAQAQHNTGIVQHIRSINPKLMSVVKQCLDNQQTGFASWIETSVDRRSFSFFARYRPNGDEKARIRSFDISPVQVANACRNTASSYRLFKPGSMVGNSAIVVTCPVLPTTDVTITLVADKGPNGFVSRLEGVLPSVTVPQVTVPPPMKATFPLDAAGYSTDHQWLDTGLRLVPGVNLAITATGRACNFHDSGCGTPAGVDTNACASAGYKCGALYAKIGNGQPFFVGESFSKTLNAGDSGSLFLGYADIYWADNTGGFSVSVTVTAPSPTMPLASFRLGKAQRRSPAPSIKGVLNTMN